MASTLHSSSRNVSRGARLVSTIAAGIGLSAVFAAQAFAATPTPYLQDSTIVGNGGTITATDVPVETSTGSLVYKDVTIQLNAAANGNLTMAPGYPKVVNAINPILNHFVAGAYTAPPSIGSKLLVTVNGPGIGAGGTTVWSLAPSNGANCGTYPASATWYTGPIAGNPLAARIKQAGITSSFYSYGLVGVSPPCAADGDNDFAGGTLIGVSQVEGSLTIVSFSYGGIDHATPIAEITYTLLP
ncbi:MAG: hypothetical protein ACREE2_13920 [Stellaceae bacterium]